MQHIPCRLPHALRQSPEVIVGCTAAACIHPIAAWRVLPRSWRILVLTVYTATGYLTVLGALFVLNR